MNQSGTEQIVDALKKKACLKQRIYRATLDTFKMFQTYVHELGDSLYAQMQEIDENVRISSDDNGKFETELKFSGDTLIFSMHTNVFNFESNHFIHQKPYIAEDPDRSYCGMIEIYNFLSDSFKYQRLNDQGYLIARIFVNKDNHFFVEGKRQLGFLYNDIESLEMTSEMVQLIVENAVLHSIDFDLWVPDYEQVQELSVQDKLRQTGYLSHKTAKRLGFKLEADRQPEA